jgi:hypothetical protein
MNRLPIIGLASIITAMPPAFGAEQKHAPLPDKLAHAKTVYLENSTGIKSWPIAFTRWLARGKVGVREVIARR